MKTMLLAVAAVLTATSVASAEAYDATQPTPPNGEYVLGAMSIGGQRDLQAAVNLEAGRSVMHPRVFARGQVTIGSNRGMGRYQQARVGLESRGCVVREFFCAFAGLDAGYQRDVVSSVPFCLLFCDPAADTVHVNAHDAVLVPRAGLELGQHIKTRVALEMPMRARLDASDDDDHSRTGRGVTLSMGWGYAF